jgi:SAM-dependent MidA family methyltransferase
MSRSDLSSVLFGACCAFIALAIWSELSTFTPSVLLILGSVSGLLAVLSLYIEKPPAP